MILSKPVIKTLLLYFHFKQPCVRDLFSYKKYRIYWRHGVDVSDDVTSTKVIRRVKDKMFSVLILLCQQVTHNKTIYGGKSVWLL